MAMNGSGLSRSRVEKEYVRVFTTSQHIPFKYTKRGNKTKQKPNPYSSLSPANDATNLSPVFARPLYTLRAPPVRTSNTRAHPSAPEVSTKVPERENTEEYTSAPACAPEIVRVTRDETASQSFTLPSRLALVYLACFVRENDAKKFFFVCSTVIQISSS
jgi:hypothetical protein